MKRNVITIIGVLLLGFAAARADNYDNKTLYAGGSTFALRCEYNEANLQSVEQSVRADNTFDGTFFVLGGDAYMATLGFGTSSADWDKFTKLTKLRYEDGEIVASEVDIDFGTYGVPQARTRVQANFVGTDSEGVPFVAYGTQLNNTGNKYQCSLEIYALKLLENGNFQAIKKYTLTIEENVAKVYTREICIDGSLASGNFTLVALAWQHNSAQVSENNSTNLALYLYAQFKNGIQQNCNFAPSRPHQVVAHVYNPTIQIIKASENDQPTCLIVDNVPHKESGYVDCTKPVVGPIMQFNVGETLSVEGESGTIEGNGAHVFSIGNHNFIIYSVTIGGVHTYSIAYLPEGPTALSKAKHLWTLTEGCAQEPYNTEFSTLRTNHIVSVPEDENKINLHVLTNSKSLAKYTILPADEVTLLPAINLADFTPEATTEYFNLLGQKVRPTSPGIYIQRKGTKTSKIIIR